jgi:hypothetical protein
MQFLDTQVMERNFLRRTGMNLQTDQPRPCPFWVIEFGGDNAIQDEKEVICDSDDLVFIPIVWTEERLNKLRLITHEMAS